jgi:ubiquitin C-terminal hydrolase
MKRELSDRMACKIWRPRILETIKRLLAGRGKVRTRCLHVDFSILREETFYDSRVDVPNCGNLKAAWDDSLHPYLLTGDQQYEAEGHGKQDAERSVTFTKFPPVLVVNLKRFSIDRKSYLASDLSTNRFEFPTRLDLRPYLAQDQHPGEAQGEAEDTGGARRPRGGRRPGGRRRGWGRSPSACTRCSCTAGMLRMGAITRTSGPRGCPRGASGSSTRTTR